jgi:acetyl-CoA C-acetyltransferase
VSSSESNQSNPAEQIVSGGSSVAVGGSPAVIVGVGQIRRRPELDGEWSPQEPTQLMALAIQAALRDAVAHGAGDVNELTSAVGTLACVDPIAWGYIDLVASTAEVAGLTPIDAMTWPPGGNSPGDLLNTIANRIMDGEITIAVLSGSEAVYSVRRARKEGVDLRQTWTPFDGKRDFQKGQRPLTTPVEARHGMVAPVQCYPMFENAIRAAAGRSIDEHQHVVSTLMSRNSEVAAQNPHAWFPVAWSSEDIATVTPTNRWVCFPYPKRMNAIMEVDQSAAVVVMSQAEADRRGIDRANQVAVLGGASCVDAWTPAERPSLSTSPAIAAAGKAAMDAAGVALADIDLIDLYSCFPSAVQMGMSALGIPEGDQRGVSLTGGLAYAGGPGNSYALHSMCVATDRIRTGSAKTALVTSLGMTASKHAVTILGGATSDMTKSGMTESGEAATFRSHKLVLDDSLLNGPELVDEQSGDGVVASYTVEYGRDGTATRTIYIVDLDEGSRTVGNGMCTEEEVMALTTTEAVGRRVHVAAGSVESATPNTVAFL